MMRLLNDLAILFSGDIPLFHAETHQSCFLCHAKAQRLIQTNSKQGAVVSSKDEKALRVCCWVCSFATTKYTKKTRTKKVFGWLRYLRHVSVPH